MLRKMLLFPNEWMCVFVIKLAMLNEDRSLLFLLFEGSCIHFEAKGREILNFNPEYNYLHTFLLISSMF